MPFPNSVREDALVRAQRHCCICHEFAGRSINVHHIEQEADGGENTLENAIVLCLRCHAEAGHFNPRHPLGTKYSPSELKKHRDAWFESCENGSAVFSSTIEAKFKRTYTASELHKYILLFTFHNGNKHVVNGWKLDILIPSSFPVLIQDVEHQADTVFEGSKYKKYHLSGREEVYLGESVELTDPEYSKIEYSINSDVYYSARTQNFKVIWRFYTTSDRPLNGELQWEYLQEF